MTTTRVAALQLAPVVGDLPGNTERALAALTGAVDAGAQVVVLPELVTSGYVFASVEEARALAVRPDDALFDAWAAQAGRAPGGAGLVVGGFAELDDDGTTVHNSAALVDASGVRAVYRKVHLWDTEKRFFRPGDAAPPVIETAHGRVGAVVCFDLEFPEFPRTVALRGADLLAVPTNWPLVPRPAGERPPEVQIALATARANKMAIACADRVGTERGVEWTGGTGVISAEGWLEDTAGDGVGAAVADLDLAASREKVIAPQVHLFDDRRPELYGALTEPR